MRMNMSAAPGEPALRPLSARSVVLSLLLGTHPPELAARDLVRGVEPFGVGGSTVRAALSRMVTAGDLQRTDTVYRLSGRLLARQRRQDDALDPDTRPWDGDWEMAAITASGRGPAERAELRTRLADLRLAELREGLWLRPANLGRPWPADLADVLQRFTGRPERPAGELAADLWPLEPWADAARALLDRAERSPRPADRFTALAAVVRHLLADPVLPPGSCRPTGRARRCGPDTVRTSGNSWRWPGARWGGRPPAHDGGGRAKRRAGTLRTAAFTVGGLGYL